MLKRAIGSVLGQTSKATEIIVVDDGSTDETSTLFPMENVTYFKIEHCGYPGKVRNRGVELSKGQFLAFLDSDDVWLPNKLEEQRQYFKNNPECQLLHTKERWIMGDKVVSQKKRKHKKSGDVFLESLQGCILGPSTVLLNKDLYNRFNGFDETIEVGEDYDLWLRICNDTKVDYLDKELIIKYAGHKDQLSFKYGFIEPFKIHVLKKLIIGNYLTTKNRLLAVESINKKFDIIINGCIKRDKISESVNYVNQKEDFLKSI